MRGLGASVASMVSAVVLVGCTAAAPTTAPIATSSAPASSVPLATSTWSPGPSASYMGLPLSGTLAADPTGCLYVTSDDGERYTLLWPQGFTAERRARALVVLDAGRRVVARTGDHVSLSGGATPPSAELGSCDPSRRDFYEINDDFLP